MTPKGDRVQGGDRQGRGGDLNSPATQAAADNRPEYGASCKYVRLGSAVQQVKQENGSETESGGGEGGQSSTPGMDAASVAVARPEHGASREYGLLATEEPPGDQDDKE